jgi:hypothetical protein
MRPAGNPENLGDNGMADALRCFGTKGAATSTQPQRKCDFSPTRVITRITVHAIHMHNPH